MTDDYTFKTCHKLDWISQYVLCFGSAFCVADYTMQLVRSPNYVIPKIERQGTIPRPYLIAIHQQQVCNILETPFSFNQFCALQNGMGSNPGIDTICGLSLLLALSFSPRGFSPCTLVFPSPQKPTFPNSNSTRYQVDVGPVSGCASSKLLFIYLFYSPSSNNII